jgi:hypothetical protein
LTLSRLRHPAVVEPLLQVLREKTDPETAGKWKRLYPIYIVMAVAKSGAREHTAARTLGLYMKARPQRGYPSDALNCLSLFPEQHRPGIVEAMGKSEDPAVRCASLWFLCALVGKPGFKTAAWLQDGLTPFLDDKDLSVRREAARRLLDAGKLPALGPAMLTKMVQCGDPGVVGAVAGALAANPSKDGVAPMLELLSHAKQREPVMPQVVKFFTEAPDRRAADPLAEYLLTDNPVADPERLAEAVRLCAADVPAAAKRIAAGLQHPSADVRKRAAIALGVLGDKSVLPSMAEAARDATRQDERDAIATSMERLTKQP